MGAIVSFYFGARHQAKGQAFQESVARTVAMGGHLRPGAPREPENPALVDWEAKRER